MNRNTGFTASQLMLGQREANTPAYHLSPVPRLVRSQGPLVLVLSPLTSPPILMCIVSAVARMMAD